jgi:hypothetical protein
MPKILTTKTPGHEAEIFGRCGLVGPDKKIQGFTGQARKQERYFPRPAPKFPPAAAGISKPPFKHYSGFSKLDCRNRKKN